MTKSYFPYYHIHILYLTHYIVYFSTLEYHMPYFYQYFQAGVFHLRHNFNINDRPQTAAIKISHQSHNLLIQNQAAYVADTTCGIRIMTTGNPVHETRLLCLINSGYPLNIRQRTFESLARFHILKGNLYHPGARYNLHTGVMQLHFN